tara:strand:- start:345 stop:854 length:510 start_codon:yes stop_codon:yes gene_type:complete
MNARLLLLSSLMLGGCVQTIRFPPDMWPDDRDFGRADRDTIDIGCHGETPHWSGSVEVLSWDDIVVLELTRDDWTELHPMPQSTSADRGAEYRLGPLEGGVPEEEQNEGVSSAFDCQLDASELLYVLRVRSAVGTLTDCVWWGALPPIDHAIYVDDEIDGIGGCSSLDE